MESMIPKSVDCIIIGTGLTNSILAAACSRIGKSVLHVDKNGYYGEEWASFTFQQLIDWIKARYPQDVSLQNIPEELNTKSRMFCIDLCPRLLYSNGPMVDLLVKSNVSRYHEFKNNIRILSLVDDELHVMPCRRSDVFTSPLLSNLVDKRRLMKFIELCIKYEPGTENAETSEITQNANKPIADFLEEKGLNRVLKEYIINSIAMVRPTDSTEEACRSIKNFMVATEKYGRSPFIFPLYGCGEFPQSFCRLSAVFGGVYCLNTNVDSVKISDNFVVKFSDKGHEVTSDKLVMDHTSALTLNLTITPVVKDKLSRAILVTKKSIVQNDDHLISFLRIPPSDRNANTVYLLELNSSVTVCPPGLNLVYLWTRASTKNAMQDLSSTVSRIFKDNQDITWKFFYQQLCESNNCLIGEDLIPNLHITSPPCNDIDYETIIKEAEVIFHKICPDQEFLPRAPDPEEIINE